EPVGCLATTAGSDLLPIETRPAGTDELEIAGHGRRRLPNPVRAEQDARVSGSFLGGHASCHRAYKKKQRRCKARHGCHATWQTSSVTKYANAMAVRVARSTIT